MILGIGNPGIAYQRNLHNIGFMVLDRLAKQWSISFSQKGTLTQMAEGVTPFGKVLLLKPLTYVNLSGRVLEDFLQGFSEEENEKFVENFLVICDDINLPFGKFRFRKEGRAGGHNGLKSIETVLGQEYQRFRLGVKDEDLPKELDLKEIVLSDFGPHQKELLEKIILNSIKAIELWLEQGIMSAMNQYNGIRLTKTLPLDSQSIPEKESLKEED